MAILVMNQLFTMILLMLVGAILNKKKYLAANDAKELSVILCGQDGIISEKSVMVQQSILTINLKIQPRE